MDHILVAADRLACAYLTAVHGVRVHLSFDAIGGAYQLLGSLWLLARWRDTGGLLRPIACGVVFLLWFATLPFALPSADADLTTFFIRVVGQSIGWLALTVFLEALGPRRPRIASPRAHYLFVGAPCLATATAGVCLVGTARRVPARGPLDPRAQLRWAGLGKARVRTIRGFQRRDVRAIACLLPSRRVRLRGHRAYARRRVDLKRARGHLCYTLPAIARCRGR